jgi:hypothetical protein
VTANSLHPGVIRTGFGADGDMGGLFGLAIKIGRHLLTSPEKGAETSVYLASSPEVEGTTGRYFVWSKERRPTAYAQDAAAARRLWEVSAKMAGVGG